MYLKKWEETFKWLAPGSNNRAYCKLCNKEFSISHGGQFDVKQHAQYKGHREKEKCTSGSGSSKLSNYFVNVKKPEFDTVTACELGLVYHCVQHNLSYNSLDYGNKLSASLFHDSEIAAKVSCGRTKSERLVKNVLAPKSVNDFVEILTSPEKSSQFFSLATDASNRGNRKLFPICVRYFDPSKGIENKILNFVEKADEIANSISSLLLESLKELHLNQKHISAFSADNANVNFGKHHSVFKLLKLKNENMVKANCSNHVLHNATKYATDRLDVDIENIVLKIFNHFSVSAKRRDELKSFFDFVDLEWSEIVRHVPTRWLSLTPAVKRLLQNWPAIKSYFQSIDDCPKFFSKIFQNDDPHSDLYIQLHFNFFVNVGEVLDATAKALEKTDLSVLESFKCMASIRNKIQLRKKDHFFGNATNQLLKSLSQLKQNNISGEFCKFYENILCYLEQRYDFTENNPYSKLSTFSLSEELQYCSFENAVDLFKLQEFVNLDKLYEEFCEIRRVLLECVQCEGSVVDK